MYVYLTIYAYTQDVAQRSEKQILFYLILFKFFFCKKITKALRYNYCVLGLLIFLQLKIQIVLKVFLRNPK